MQPMKIFRYLYIYLSPYDKSPLMISSEEGKQKISKYLIDKGSDIKNESNEKLLLDACDKENCFKNIEYLLSKETKSEMTKDKILLNLFIYGDSLLHIACKSQNIKVIELLIAKGLDINAGNIQLH